MPLSSYEFEEIKHQLIDEAEPACEFTSDAVVVQLSMALSAVRMRVTDKSQLTIAQVKAMIIKRIKKLRRSPVDRNETIDELLELAKEINEAERDAIPK